MNNLEIIEVSSDWTPLSAFLSVAGNPYPFFLDGGIDPENLGRYSFAGADPFLVVHAKDGVIRVNYPRLAKEETLKSGVFTFLKGLFNRYVKKSEVPFPLARGGAVGYFAYDLYKEIEAIERTALDDLSMPDLFLAFYDRVYCYDHQAERGFAAFSMEEEHGPLPTGFRDFCMGAPPEIPELPPISGQPLLTACREPEDYKNAVRRAKEHIGAGDVYQVNLSQRFTAPFTTTPLEFYLRFRSLSPAPFGACLFPDGFTVLSNSPERYLLIDGDYIETRPIKGTMPRGRTVEEDRELADALRNSEKDGAEHVMIVDLERNDLGRVCSYNSVHVPEFKVIESYANVHHMVSTVAGRVHPSMDLVDCIRNSFPGGSITGAPKVRAIEIIDALEPTARGVYCGSIGYIDFSGRVDLNIAIRTAIHHEGALYFQVGGGIVADSDPELEYEETITKAQSFIKALTGKGRVWSQ